MRGKKREDTSRSGRPNNNKNKGPKKSNFRKSSAPGAGDKRAEKPTDGEKRTEGASFKNPHTGGPNKHSDFYKKKFRKPKGKNAEDLASTRGEMRLNRFLAISGIASRREADELIRMGLVTVNGKAVMEMGYKVKSTDDVRYQGTRIRAEKKVYVLMNKPKGYLTTMDDPKARKTVMDILGGNVKERIYPVGRLDRATTGVLLMTNDGDLAKKLTHPSHGARKIYAVALDKPLTKADLDAISKGLELEDGLAPVEDINYITDKGKNHVGIEIHIGRNHVVRNIFKQLGYEVTKLDRPVFAGLTKKNLSRGQWRYLSEKEVNFLKML